MTVSGSGDAPFVLVTDSDLTVIGDPITVIPDIDVTLNWNMPDSGSFKVPATPENMSQLVKGNRVIIIDEGEILTSGPIEKPGGYEWGVTENPEPGVVTVNFADDLAPVVARLVYPNPAQAATAQTSAYYTASTNAETIMRNLVNLNAGPGALVARRVPQLVLGALASVGTSVVVKERFTPLGDVLRNVALSGGDLGFRVIQVGSTLEFQVFAAADKTGVARFSRDMGNLQSIRYDVTAPTATTAIVGGTGEDTARTIAERVDSVAEAVWGRSEVWVEASDQEAGTGGLNQAGDQALVESGEEVSLATVAMDTDLVRYGREYGIGDLVTVEVFPGVEIADKVRAVSYKYKPKEGRSVQALIGSEAAKRSPEWVRVIERLSNRLGRLERK